MAESSATERYENCIRHHSRTCTCGIGEESPALVEDIVQALRALAYAAMTSGGTAGPDVALKDAIRWATDALKKYDTR